MELESLRCIVSHLERVVVVRPTYALLTNVRIIVNIKQPFINNGFPNYIVDTEIKQFINKPEQPNIDNILNHEQSINLNYKNQFHSNYKKDEHILKKNYPKKFSPDRPYQKC